MKRTVGDIWFKSDVEGEVPDDSIGASVVANGDEPHFGGPTPIKTNVNRGKGQPPTESLS